MTKRGSDSGSTRMLVAMVSIGLVCALLIVLTFEVTLPVIRKKKQEALQEAIFKVIPGVSRIKSFKLNTQMQLIEVHEKSDKDELVYAGYNEQDEFVGFAVEARGQGYADIISVLYGYDPFTEKIVGFYVLESKETPGLGDKIENDEDFLTNFKALDVQLKNKKPANKVTAVKKGKKVNAWEVEGITGATISSRAIGDILAESADHWIPVLHEHKDSLVTKPKEINEQ